MSFIELEIGSVYTGHVCVITSKWWSEPLLLSRDHKQDDLQGSVEGIWGHKETQLRHLSFYIYIYIYGGLKKVCGWRSGGFSHGLHFEKWRHLTMVTCSSLRPPTHGIRRTFWIVTLTKIKISFREVQLWMYKDNSIHHWRLGPIHFYVNWCMKQKSVTNK